LTQARYQLWHKSNCAIRPSRLKPHDFGHNAIHFIRQGHQSRPNPLQLCRDALQFRQSLLERLARFLVVSPDGGILSTGNRFVDVLEVGREVSVCRPGPNIMC
jgi:hypothetical protein